MAIRVAVFKEDAQGERRVAIDPATAQKLQQGAIKLTVVRGAGQAAGFPDSSYADVQIAESNQAACADQQIFVAIQLPSDDILAQLPEQSILITQVFAARRPDALAILQARRISCFALEWVPRITRAQSMDVLSSQATVAGYQAALMAADLSPRLFPMLTTAAGTLRPSQALVIGAGVAGLQAIATARRLGAQVMAYDIRPAAREQVESLGARMVDTGIDAEGEGGYARELTAEEKAQQAQRLGEHLARCDVVISTAALPGRAAPKIITTAMVEAMKPGAIILDMAAESGGNCELTQAGETLDHQGVIVAGPLHLASRSALHASEMFARNVANLMALLIDDEHLIETFDDEVLQGCLLSHGGALVHESLRTHSAS
jgi:NAD(P) transhydrogenase subunit alpha